jgi:peptide chain release factor 1
VDHFLDDDGLADAGPAEQADLATLHVGLEEVDDLDPGLEHLGPRLQLVEGRRVAMDLPVLVDAFDGVGVERLAEHVEDVAQHRVAHRDRDAPAEVAHGRAPDEAIGLLHADAAHTAVTDLLGHLGGDLVGGPVELDGEFDGVVDLGQRVGRELDVDDGPGDGDDPAVGQRSGRRRVLHGGGGHRVKLPSIGGAPRPRRRSP